MESATLEDEFDSYDDPEMDAFLARFTDEQIMSGEATRILEQEKEAAAAAQEKKPAVKPAARPAEPMISNPTNIPRNSGGNRTVYGFNRTPIKPPAVAAAVIKKPAAASAPVFKPSPPPIKKIKVEDDSQDSSSSSCASKRRPDGEAKDPDQESASSPSNDDLDSMFKDLVGGEEDVQLDDCQHEILTASEEGFNMYVLHFLHSLDLF